MHFAAAFPHLVSELLLLAPAGLIRPESFGALTRAVFTSGLVPPRLLAWITRRRLKKPIRSSASKRATAPSTTTQTSKPIPATPALLGTTFSKPPTPALLETTPLLLSPTATKPDQEPANALEHRVLRAVHWQLAHHAGFIPAFMSSIRHAPLVDQHASWARLAARAPGTTCVILGAADEIIDAREYAADALPLLGGEGKVRWRVVPGGHDFPMTFAGEVVGEMYRAWGWV